MLDGSAIRPGGSYEAPAGDRAGPAAAAGQAARALTGARQPRDRPGALLGPGPEADRDRAAPERQAGGRGDRDRRAREREGGGRARRSEVADERLGVDHDLRAAGRARIAAQRSHDPVRRDQAARSRCSIPLSDRLAGGQAGQGVLGVEIDPVDEQPAPQHAGGRPIDRVEQRHAMAATPIARHATARGPRTRAPTSRTGAPARRRLSCRSRTGRRSAQALRRPGATCVPDRARWRQRSPRRRPWGGSRSVPVSPLAGVRGPRSTDRLGKRVPPTVSVGAPPNENAGRLRS